MVIDLQCFSTATLLWRSEKFPGTERHHQFSTHFVQKHLPITTAPNKVQLTNDETLMFGVGFVDGTCAIVLSGFRLA